MAPPQGLIPTAGVMPLVLAGDGAGSGVDADTLDGSDSASFAAVSHAHSASDITSGSLAVARGGTAGSTAATARTNLGMASQAAKTDLTDSTGGAVDGTLVDVTTLAVSDPAKVNANFADCSDRINKCLAVLRAVGLMDP